jgi:ABC-type nitrate/sulfonate/bicarbonate transport system permease component
MTAVLPLPERGTRTKSAAPAPPASNGMAKWALPVVIMCLCHPWLGWIVTANEIPHYILPGPDRVWDSLVNDWGMLIDAAFLTGWITLLALCWP